MILTLIMCAEILFPIRSSPEVPDGHEFGETLFHILQGAMVKHQEQLGAIYMSITHLWDHVA